MKSVRNIVSVAKKNNDQSELFTERLRTALCFSITVSLCSLLKTSFMLRFCIQFFFLFFLFFFFFFLIKKCSLSQKSILFQQNKLFHEGNRTIATRIIVTWTIAPQTIAPWTITPQAITP